MLAKFKVIFVNLKIFFYEVLKENRQQTACWIIKQIKLPCAKHNYFLIGMPGSFFNFPLKASNILKNKSLFDRFSLEDKNKIIIHSGACRYKIADVIYYGSRDIVVAIQANVFEATIIKRYAPKDIITNETLLNLLSSEDKGLVKSIYNQSKISHINPVSHTTRF